MFGHANISSQPQEQELDGFSQEITAEVVEDVVVEEVQQVRTSLPRSAKKRGREPSPIEIYSQGSEHSPDEDYVDTKAKKKQTPKKKKRDAPQSAPSVEQRRETVSSVLCVSGLVVKKDDECFVCDLYGYNKESTEQSQKVDTQLGMRKQAWEAYKYEVIRFDNPVINFSFSYPTITRLAGVAIGDRGLMNPQPK